MDEQITDRELLREFVQRRSERAFGLLVQRHANLVYGTALRFIHDPTAAQDITQDVFVTLARKAMWIGNEVVLTGWLHKAALLRAQQFSRSESRRRLREQVAADNHTTMKDHESSLKSLVGVLDEGLLTLREKERQALILHYL